MGSLELPENNIDDDSSLKLTPLFVKNTRHTWKPTKIWNCLSFVLYCSHRNVKHSHCSSVEDLPFSSSLRHWILFILTGVWAGSHQPLAGVPAYGQLPPRRTQGAVDTGDAPLPWRSFQSPPWSDKLTQAPCPSCSLLVEGTINESETQGNFSFYWALCLLTISETSPYQ